MSLRTTQIKLTLARQQMKELKAELLQSLAKNNKLRKDVERTQKWAEQERALVDSLTKRVYDAESKVDSFEKAKADRDGLTTIAGVPLPEAQGVILWHKKSEAESKKEKAKAAREKKKAQAQPGRIVARAKKCVWSKCDKVIKNADFCNPSHADLHNIWDK